jgi:hypothetical protein
MKVHYSRKLKDATATLNIHSFTHMETEDINLTALFRDQPSAGPDIKKLFNAGL